MGPAGLEFDQQRMCLTDGSRTIRMKREACGKVWWQGKKTAIVLGYQSPADMVRHHVPEIHRKPLRCLVLAIEESPCPQSDEFEQPDTIYIDEAGLYCLIIGSQLPTARPFKEWVTGTVLPTIRSEGSYSLLDDASGVASRAASAHPSLPPCISICRLTLSSSARCFAPCLKS
jgi:prophage antirepressor-like protein